MTSFNRSYVLRLTKWTLMLVGLLIIILAIAFLGPYLGLGEMRPLTSITARMMLSLFVLFWFFFLLFRLPLIFPLLATLGMVIWVFGPFMRVGEISPLAPVAVREGIIIAIFFIAMLYSVWRLMKVVRSNSALLNPLVKKRDVQPDETAIREVRNIIKHAVHILKTKQRKISSWRLFFTSRRAAEALPWYIAIGPEQAGKTAAILSSGQAFPIPEQLACMGKRSAPTTCCECWFTNEAIFIDTAGKYVSDEEKANNEWITLLKEIRKQRPLRPINGVMMMLSAAEVMTPDKAARYALSSRLRARLEEIKNHLGMHFPVYLCITQMDRLAGFTPYFRTLTPEAREQIWGFTLPYGEDNKRMASDLKGTIEAELALLEERIERGITLRMQEEYDTADRKQLYSLPQDFSVLAAGVAEIAHHLFLISRYEDTQKRAQLRGIYFTSVIQPGKEPLINQQTLIQKWRNYVAGISSSLGTVEETKAETGYAAVNDANYSKHYFLQRLFSDLIIKDAALAGFNSLTTLHYRAGMLSGHAICMGIVIWLLYGLYHSYSHNNAYLAEINKRAETVKKEVEHGVDATQEALLPGLLRLSYQLPVSEQFDIHHPPVAYRYGLYTGDVIRAAADRLHTFFLQRLLLPAIEEQATLALKKAITSENRDELYRQLKTYLMVFGQGKMERHWLTDSLLSQWQSAGRAEAYGDRKTLATFIETLLSGAAWRKYGQAADAELVAQARTLLQKESPARRIYEQLKEKILSEIAENITLNKLTGEQDSGLFTLNDPQMALSGISGLFSYEGYHHFFKKYLKEFIRQLQSEEHWVIGTRKISNSLRVSLPFDLSGDKLTESETLQDAVLRLYLKEYARNWSTFISNIRLKSDAEGEKVGNNLTFDIYALRMMIAPDSPLKNLIVNLVRETTLAAPLPGKAGATQKRMDALLHKVAQVQETLAFHETKLLHEQLDNYFSALHELVRPYPQKAAEEHDDSPGLEAILAMLREYYTFLVITREAIKNGDMPPVTDKAQQLRAAALSWPEPLGNIILSLLKKTTLKINGQIVDHLSHHARSGIGEACRAVVADKYPFSDSRQEVQLRDFERLFGKGGLMDQYFQSHLADKVEIATKPWRYKQAMQISASGKDILPSFEQAAEIQRFFFQGEDGKKLHIPFVLSVVFMQPDINAIKINVNESQYKYKHGPVVPVNFVWDSATDTHIGMSIQPEDVAFKFTGPWALLHWLDQADQLKQTPEGRLHLSYSLTGNVTTTEKAATLTGIKHDTAKKRLTLEITGLSNNALLLNKMLRQFRCPSAE
ncbi:type VI secretion system membrane subunit TssM [[Erwinia] mediterraneensis]|uniref:type VI secretion system membrane subunit TssM n=1 Tax=[Erwinia] mediterraneensis TaxID=2161819 RepID=UPI0010306AFF|nr:type VI secretion system membrane subunit TssM [[Erwinia] mediterraneensis]